MAASRRVVWTGPARRELIRNVEYVAQRSPAAAERLLTDLLSRAAHLDTFPERGRRVPAITWEVVREVYVRRYRIMYRVLDDEVVIVTLVHGSRDLRAVLENIEP